MGGLRRGVDHELNSAAVLGKDAVDRRAVTDVDFEAAKRVAQLAQEAVRGRLGRRLGAEETGPHVVLEADHVVARAREVRRRLGPDQAARAGHDGDRHTS